MINRHGNNQDFKIIRKKLKFQKPSKSRVSKKMIKIVSRIMKKKVIKKIIKKMKMKKMKMIMITMRTFKIFRYNN